MSAPTEPPFGFPFAAPTERRLPLKTGLAYHMLTWEPEGEASGTVILLHGFLDFAWGWAPMVSAGRACGLLSSLRILAPDLRGHGESDAVGAGGYYHFVDYLADLHDLIDQGVGRGSPLMLVGHSMGGSVAAYFAGTFPERICRLALLEGLGPPEDHQDVPARVATWIAAWRRVRDCPPRCYPDVEAAASRLREHDPLLDEDLARWLAERGTLKAAGGLCFRHDPLHVTPGPLPFRVALAESFWRRIQCPVLLVDAAESYFRHATAETERREAALAHRRKVVLPGAGHMMQRHQPLALARLLHDFLSQPQST